MIKKIITKEETLKNMIKSIINVDLSGNEEKLADVQYFNEKFISFINVTFFVINIFFI